MIACVTKRNISVIVLLLPDMVKSIVCLLHKSCMVSVQIPPEL